MRGVEHSLAASAVSSNQSAKGRTGLPHNLPTFQPSDLIIALSAHTTHPFTLTGHSMAKQRLSSMNIEELVELRNDVNAALDDKAKGLRLQLQQLGNGSEPRKRGGVKGRKVPPKYRSKKNPKLTWAGRGATPI